MKTIARRVARGRIEGMGLPMPEETLDALVNLIARMSVMHARGDEKPDEGMKEAIEDFAALLGGEADMESFTFDFPPEDNRLIINLKKDKNERIMLKRWLLFPNKVYICTRWLFMQLK